MSATDELEQRIASVLYAIQTMRKWGFRIVEESTSSEQPYGDRLRRAAVVAGDLLGTKDAAATERVGRTFLQNVNTPADAIEGTLGYMRLQRAILLYVGADSADVLLERLARVYGTETANALCRHVFDLNNAPLAETERAAIRKACDGGNCRW